MIVFFYPGRVRLGWTIWPWWPWRSGSKNWSTPGATGATLDWGRPITATWSQCSLYGCTGHLHSHTTAVDAATARTGWVNKHDQEMQLYIDNRAETSCILSVNFYKYSHKYIQVHENTRSRSTCVKLSLFKKTFPFVHKTSGLNII